jgi:eukaryotic-like serine/threonine-protein kinase
VTSSDDDKAVSPAARTLEEGPRSSASGARDDLVGATLGNYCIVARLGEGGMGVVYRAEDTRLRRTVALKVLLDATQSEEKRQRFLREARSAAAVTHPNVAVVYQIDEAGGRIYIAMELVEGENLRESIRRGPLEVAAARELSGQIARGLAAAHAKGIVHRDLKPENVMVTPAGDVKLLDFGIAKSARELASSSEPPLSDPAASFVTTELGHILGTPEYMSPEQAMGDPLDVRSDVFSLGIVLYEMLAGARPFHGSTPGAVMASIARDPSPPLRPLAPGVDPETEAIVLRCLAKAPRDRFASAGEIVAALSGRTPQRVTPLSRPEVQPMTRGEGAPHDRRWKTGSVAAAWAAVALAIGVGAWLARSGGHGQGVPPVPARTLPAPSAAAPVLRFTDVPPPASSSPEALKAYEEGMRAQHDGVNMSYVSFERALTLDPTLAAAALRLTEMYVGARQLGAARPYYRRLLDHMDRLSVRDRAIAAAVEPAVLTDPPDWMEAARRLHALSDSAPGDLGVLLLAGRVSQAAGDGARARADLEAATRADPEFGVAFGALVHLARDERRDDDVRTLAERCLAAVPRATDCVASLADAAAAAGQCDVVLAQGRRFIAASPDDRWGYTYLASALAALGEPWDSVQDATAQANLHQTGNAQTRQAIALQRLASVAALRGDFVACEVNEDGIENQGLLSAYDYFDPRQAVTEGRVDLAIERGDPPRAAQVAVDYLRRRSAYRPPELSADLVPMLLDVERAAGTITAQSEHDQMETWRRGWSDHFQGHLPAQAWVVGDAQVVRTRDEAVAALAVRPPLDQLASGFHIDVVGRVSALAGRSDEAAQLLSRAASDCMVLDHPFATVRANLRLGEIYEQTGDRTSACARYAKVLERWGDAKPRSVTADEARAHATKLGCGP